MNVNQKLEFRPGKFVNNYRNVNQKVEFRPGKYVNIRVWIRTWSLDLVSKSAKCVLISTNYK